MLSANLSLRADKSQAYFDSLCKHFARKVEVERVGNQASVAFLQGSCSMSVEDDLLMLVVHAGDSASLETVKTIITTHVVRFSAFDDGDMNWCAADSVVVGAQS